MKNKIIKLSKKHIEKGVKLDNKKCPVALALKEKFSKSKKTVDIAKLRIEINGKVLTPSLSLYNFMENFDRGKVVYPGKIIVYFTNNYISFISDCN